MEVVSGMTIGLKIIQRFLLKAFIEFRRTNLICLCDKSQVPPLNNLYN